MFSSVKTSQKDSTVWFFVKNHCNRKKDASFSTIIIKFLCENEKDFKFQYFFFCWFTVKVFFPGHVLSEVQWMYSNLWKWADFVVWNINQVAEMKKWWLITFRQNFGLVDLMRCQHFLDYLILKQIIFESQCTRGWAVRTLAFWPCDWISPGSICQGGNNNTGLERWFQIAILLGSAW